MIVFFRMEKLQWKEINKLWQQIVNSQLFYFSLISVLKKFLF